MSSVAQLSDRLEDLKGKRTELEAEREAIVRQMQQFHAQIAVRRKEGTSIRSIDFLHQYFFPSIFRTRYMETKISLRKEENRPTPRTRPTEISEY